jgi:ABC-type nitrate/sulfonate/bicarbonate transport system substrate-binding protein
MGSRLHNTLMRSLKARGFYAEAGLDVTLLSPHHDAYKTTPASRLADGNADFAVTPSETVVSAHTQPAGSSKPKLVAVAALQQVDTSAIVTLKSSGIDTPAKLDGKVYSSYGARYEGRIVQALIQADGGSGEYIERVDEMLGIWQTLLAGKADATWVFMGWEGIEAARKGVELNVFRLKDASVPYGYSPVLAANPEKVDAQTTRAFLAATARGFAEAAASPEAAARDFVALAVKENPGLPTPLDEAMCVDSLKWLAAEGAIVGAGWGRMEEARWRDFLGWLHARGLLTSAVNSRAPDGGEKRSLDELRAGAAGELVAVPEAAALFTNEYLSV